MRRAPVILIAFGWSSSLAIGCGLGWTLPTSLFNGVEEHGYVSYWEKIGQVDLGDGLIVPININFNSHRESSSPTLGKGWMVALLESHVEPIDENSMKVVMPDGWNYYFHRNGNTETWAGNAGWVGETNNTLFTITAPCGGKIKFDGGKIQEIDTNKNRTLAYKYNGPVATEVDIDGKPFVQVESNATTEASEDLLIGGQKLEISESQRPQVLTKLNQNFIVGFDQSLNGRMEGGNHLRSAPTRALIPPSPSPLPIENRETLPGTRPASRSRLMGHGVIRSPHGTPRRPSSLKDQDKPTSSSPSLTTMSRETPSKLLKMAESSRLIDSPRAFCTEEPEK
jgi:hypothetical protein